MTPTVRPNGLAISPSMTEIRSLSGALLDTFTFSVMCMGGLGRPNHPIGARKLSALGPHDGSIYMCPLAHPSAIQPLTAILLSWPSSSPSPGSSRTFRMSAPNKESQKQGSNGQAEGAHLGEDAQVSIPLQSWPRTCTLPHLSIGGFLIRQTCKEDSWSE